MDESGGWTTPGLDDGKWGRAAQPVGRGSNSALSLAGAAIVRTASAATDSRDSTFKEG